MQAGRAIRLSVLNKKKSVLFIRMERRQGTLAGKILIKILNEKSKFCGSFTPKWTKSDDNSGPELSSQHFARLRAGGVRSD